MEYSAIKSVTAFLLVIQIRIVTMSYYFTSHLTWLLVHSYNSGYQNVKIDDTIRKISNPSIQYNLLDTNTVDTDTGSSHDQLVKFHFKWEVTAIRNICRWHFNA